MPILAPADERRKVPYPHVGPLWVCGIFDNELRHLAVLHPSSSRYQLDCALYPYINGLELQSYAAVNLNADSALWQQLLRVAEEEGSNLWSDSPDGSEEIKRFGDCALLYALLSVREDVARPFFAELADKGLIAPKKWTAFLVGRNACLVQRPPEIDPYLFLNLRTPAPVEFRRIFFKRIDRCGRVASSPFPHARSHTRQQRRLRPATVRFRAASNPRDRRGLLVRRKSSAIPVLVAIRDPFHYPVLCVQP